MRERMFKAGVFCRYIIALALVLSLIPFGQSPALALSPGEYFTVSYVVEFSKDEIYGNEIFYVVVTTQATCIKDLPLSVSEALITGRVVAEHEGSGAKLILNSSYTVSLSPFPAKEGEVTQVSQSVPLQFPAGSQPGAYSVVGELIEAKVKAILWFTVTSYLPSSQPMGSVTYLPDSGPPPEPSSPEPPPGTTSISGKINWQGIVTETISASSVDKGCSILLNEGTKALDKSGQPLEEISIVKIEYPQAPPENRSIIGLAYDIGPDEASFDPPLILTMTYDESQLPGGVSEGGLVIATWNESEGKWFELDDGVVDSVANTISVPISHFTAFAIIAHTAPSSFTVSDLAISPAEVDIGGRVEITLVITNSGDLPGYYELALKINDEIEETREITLPGGASEIVTFGVAKNVAGSYLVNINGLASSFLVREITAPASPAETTAPIQAITLAPALPAETTTPSLTSPAETTAPSLTSPIPATTLAPALPAETTTPSLTSLIQTTAPSPAPPAATNWWRVGGIYTIDLALLVTILWLMRRRRRLRTS